MTHRTCSNHRGGWSRLTPWLRTGLAFGLLATLAAAQERWGPHPPASADGHRYDDLFWLITRDLTICFVAVLFPLLIVMFRDRARPGHKARYLTGTRTRDKYFTAVICLVVFVLLDGVVLVRALRDLREVVFNIPRAADDEDVFRVEVLAQQWAWNFRTPGVDGEFGTPDDIVTLNRLTIPNGRPAVFNMASKDVIHSFFVPDMRVKRDVNPGTINTVWFRPKDAGDYHVLCAELCGFAHYQMQGTLSVMEREAFDAWEREASGLALAAYAENDREAQWAWDWKE